MPTRHIFPERQKRAKRTTYILFAVLVIYSFTFTFLASALVLGITEFWIGQSSEEIWNSLWEWRIHLPMAILMSFFLLLLQQQKYRELARGGFATAVALRARRIYPSTDDSTERMAMNTLSEMSLASGIPLPLLFVVPQEKSINAFAAGSELSDAVIGISEAALQKLSRDELQALLAHEISHIVHKDLTINNHLTAFISAVDCFRRSGLKISEGKDGKVGYIHPTAACLVVLGYLGHWTGKLIQSAISRQRELLADSSAVQFTRNPVAFASLLRKVQREEENSSWQRSETEMLQHSFFSAAFPDYAHALLATHPTLGSRLMALGPIALEASRAVQEIERDYTEDISRIDREQVITQSLFLPLGYQAQDFLESFQKLHPEGLFVAESLLSSIPALVQNAMKNPYGARAMIYTLVLHPDMDLRIQQLNALLPLEDYFVKEEIKRLIPIVDRLPRGRLFPLVDLSMPALLELSKPEREFFSKNLEAVLKKSKENSLRFGLQAILDRRLFHPANLNEKQTLGKAKFQRLAWKLLNQFAHISTKSVGIEEETIEKLLAILELPLHYDDGPITQSWEEFLSLATTLRNCSDKQFEALLLACGTIISIDGKVDADEYEALRCICELMEIPMPPIDPSLIVSSEKTKGPTPRFHKRGF